MARANPNKFQQFCIDNGLTAREVAERLGISQYTVYAYWRGERLPSRKVERKMEAEFGINTREMF